MTLQSNDELARAVVAVIDSGPVHCDAGTVAYRLERAGYSWKESPRKRGESSYPRLRFVLWRLRRDGIVELRDGKLCVTAYRKWL